MLKLDTLTVRIRNLLRGGGFSNKQFRPPGQIPEYSPGSWSDSHDNFKLMV